jgi:hypothetical protein
VPPQTSNIANSSSVFYKTRAIALLLIQTRPFLCSGCHSTTGTMGHAVWGNNTLGNTATAVSPLNVLGGTPNKRMTGRSCQNCHSMIHGSNSPSGARFQR